MSRQNEPEMNGVGDVVLIYYQDEPSVYARIEDIAPDVKKDWYQVTLLMLTIPPQTATWILREAYINGTPFTMGGQPLRIESVQRVEPEKPSEEEEQGAEGERERNEGPAKVIPLHRKPTG
ncbi:MAG: hypothetical protein PVG49_12425 [Desulfobacteraceae bacterium]|jgi:hypothetical protein